MCSYNVFRFSSARIASCQCFRYQEILFDAYRKQKRYHRQPVNRCFSYESFSKLEHISSFFDSAKESTSLCVWEQSISSSSMGSTVSSADSEDQESKNDWKESILGGKRGGVLYRPHGSPHNVSVDAWEMVTPTKSSNKGSISSRISSIVNSYRGNRKSKLLDIQNLPFIHHFLPANYPHSVSPSYLPYASYCFIGSIAGSSAMVLSTQALLLAVGVGTQSAAPMAAALNWVMKDGVGQFGGVIFASQLGKGGMDIDGWKRKCSAWLGRSRSPISSYEKNSVKRRGNFQRGTADSNPKRWRMVAALALDLSTLLEICTPMMGPDWFLPCASIANIGKNVGFLAASASRAAVHQNLCLGGTVSFETDEKSNKSVDDEVSTMKNSDDDKSKKNTKGPLATSTGNNLGDVTAKAGSQAIVASLLGTAFGIVLSQTFCSDYGTTGILAGFVVLSGVHQVCTYKALRAVPLKSLDRHRLHLVLMPYITKFFESIVNNTGGHSELKVLTPSQVAEQESFLPIFSPDDSINWLTVGAPLTDICPNGIVELKQILRSRNPDSQETLNGKGWSLHNDFEKYILKVHFSPSDAGSNCSVQLTFLNDASDDDLLRGMFHAYLAKAFALERYGTINCDENDGLDAKEYDELGFKIMKESYSIMNCHFSSFLNNLRRGGWQVGSDLVSVECGSSKRLMIMSV